MKISRTLIFAIVIVILAAVVTTWMVIKNRSGAYDISFTIANVPMPTPIIKPFKLQGQVKMLSGSPLPVGLTIEFGGIATPVQGDGKYLTYLEQSGSVGVRFRDSQNNRYQWAGHSEQFDYLSGNDMELNYIIEAVSAP